MTKDEVQKDPVTFDFHGTVFQAADKIPYLSFAAYAEVARMGIGFGDPEGMSALLNLMRSCLSETRTWIDEDGDEITRTQWPVFEAVCASKGVTLDEIFETIEKIQGAISSRPLEQTSDLPPGQPETGKSSSTKASPQGQRTTMNVELKELQDKVPANGGV